MIEETPKNEEFVEDHLFKLTMEKKWDQVVEIYRKHPRAHITKLTKSEETALHIAISSYHSQFPTDIVDHIQRMIDSIEKNCSLSEILSMQNVKGNTPLHLAAAVGCLEICKCIALKNHQLISIRNANGETPLFVAAHHGKMQAFLLLQKIYNERKYQEEEETEAEAEAKARDLHDESLCRRKDGNTILHSAICGEYFALAYQIISDYPKLVNSVNEDGESPLHVLARMPHVFRSSNQLGFCDSIIYYCVFVDELKQQKYNPAWTSPTDYTPTSNINIPENYRTCMNILYLLIWAPISKTISASFPRLCKDKIGNPPDEENQELTENEDQVKDAKEKTKDDAVFPPNYSTCIRIFKFAMTVILTVLGVGFWRIKKIKEKKERHSHAFEIMSKMIETESSYKYDSNGQRPVRKLEHEGIEIPDVPPHDDDDDDSETNVATTPSTKSKHEKEIYGKYHNKKSEKEKKKKEKEKEKKKAREWNLAKDTPLLVAAKMGIPEMVKKIISTCPVAIQDLDVDGKNVLLLAAENKHINVFDYLVEANLPEYMFHQVDNEGNSILHLAAMLGEKQPWRIPGSALQMQWEIKWYEHVKNSVPRLSFAHRNLNGETPRKIFTQTHEKLVKEGNEWLIKTSESCSVVAALIATVAFATSATVPGGLDESTGHPTLEEYSAFDIFSITSLVALCLSVTALVCFLAIITSRCEERDFRTNLPRKLLIGLTSLFASIAAMLLSFCAGHTFILREKLRVAAVPIYAVASVPISFFAVAQLPLYFDLMWAACRKVPLRSYKVFYQ